MLGLAVLAAAAAYVVLFSPLFWVKQVTIEGTKNTNADEVRRAAEDEAGQSFGMVKSRSLALVDPVALSAELKGRFGDFSKVDVTKQWPNGLRVTVTERESTLLWKTKDSYYQVDGQGVAFAKGEPGDRLLLVEDNQGVPVEAGKQIVSPKFIRVLLEVRQQMEAAGIPVESFRIPESTFEVQAVTKDRWYALFDTTRPIPTQVQALQLAVRSQKPTEYADVRVPGRVYVR